MQSYDDAQRIRESDRDEEIELGQAEDASAPAYINSAAVVLAVTATSDVQRIAFVGTPTSGSQVFNGVNPLTGAAFSITVAFNATAANVQTALTTANGAGTATCAGGPLPGSPVTITFAGTWANRPVLTLTLGTSTLAGGTAPHATVTKLTWGEGPFPTVANAFYKIQLGAIVGTETEGATATISSGAIVYAYNVGAHIPAIGQQVLASETDFRWIIQV